MLNNSQTIWPIWTYVGSKNLKNRCRGQPLSGYSIVLIDFLPESPEGDLFGQNRKFPKMRISVFGGLVLQNHWKLRDQIEWLPLASFFRVFWAYIGPNRSNGLGVVQHEKTPLNSPFFLMLGRLSRPDATVEPSPSHGNLLGSSTIRYYMEVS